MRPKGSIQNESQDGYHLARNDGLVSPSRTSSRTSSRVYICRIRPPPSCFRFRPQRPRRVAPSWWLSGSPERGAGHAARPIIPRRWCSYRRSYGTRPRCRRRPGLRSCEVTTKIESDSPQHSPSGPIRPAEIEAGPAGDCGDFWLHWWRKGTRCLLLCAVKSVHISDKPPRLASLDSGPDQPLLGLCKSSGTLGILDGQHEASRDAKPKAEPSAAERNASRPTGR